MRNKGVWMLLVLLCCGLSAPAKHDDPLAREPIILSQRSISDSAWKRLSSDPSIARYQNLYEAHEISQPQPPRRQTDPWFLKMLLGIARFFSSPLGKFLLWLFAAAIIVYVVYRLGSGRFSFRRKKVFGTEEQQNETEDLDGTDWERHLREAIAAGDIRLAVRYSYMRVLQLLQEKELIRYTIDKTNYDYYHELTDTPYKQPFRHLSRQYEYTWYGNYPLTQEAYQQYLNDFQTFKSVLKSS